MDFQQHPLDIILQDFPGVTRISEVHRLTSDPEEGVDAVLVILAIARGTGQFVSPEALRCNIRITPEGVYMGVASDIYTGELLDVSVWDVSMGKPMRPYFVGLEMYECSPVRGGAGVNPLCFALEDTGLTKAVTDRITRRWITVVRKQPHLFCSEGVATLRELKVI